MRKILALLILTFFITACSQSTNEKKEKSKNMIKNNYTLIYNFPFCGEVLVNNVVLDKHLFDNLTGTEFLNSYILDNGSQKISVKLYSPFHRDTLISPEELKKSSEEFALYNTVVENNEIKDLKLIQKLDFPTNDKSLPLIEYEWKFQSNLPFELQGWKNGENLNNWDQDKLQQAVVGKFQQLREMLDQGNTKAFMKELEFSNTEYFISNYYSENKKSEYLENLSSDLLLLKGKVPQINNYKIRIMGDGKVVTLEAINKYEGLGVLTTEDLVNKKLYPIYIMLYKPSNSSDFKIVRFFSYKVSLVK